MLRKMMRVFLACILTLHYGETGAIRVKSVEASAKKWADNAGRAGTEMADGAVAAADDWQRNTAAGADNYHMAVSAASTKERFRRGVIKAGANKFIRKIQAVAASRFTEGVGAATDDYKTGVEPFLSTIAGLTLSARKPKGDPANYRRVEEVGKALNAKKIALLGGS